MIVSNSEGILIDKNLNVNMIQNGVLMLAIQFNMMVDIHSHIFQNFL
jgi:hypothetical protein